METNLLANYYEKSHAIIIGINKYREESPLTNAQNDATAIMEVLKKKYGFTVIRSLFNEDATAAQITDLFDDLLPDRNKIGPKDRVIIYYSGHGKLRVNPGRGGEVIQEGYIVPYDSKKERYTSNIPMKTIIEICQNCLAKHVLLILDCCYSGFAATRAIESHKPQRTATEKYVKDISSRIAVQVFAAGQEDQPVSDSGTRPGYSAFTGALLDILESETDPDNNGILTASEIGFSLERQVTLQQQRGAFQRPVYSHISGSQGGDFIFKIFDKVKIDTQPNTSLQDNPPTTYKRVLAKTYYIPIVVAIVVGVFAILFSSHIINPFQGSTLNQSKVNQPSAKPHTTNNPSSSEVLKILSYTNTTFAAKKTLFAISPSSGDIYKYNGKPFIDNWTRVGSSSNRSNMVAGNDFNLFKANSSGVFQWMGSPDMWKKIDSIASKGIYAADDMVYSIREKSKNNIFKYNGKPGDWTAIGTAGITFTASNSNLYGFNPDYYAIFEWNGKNPYNAGWTNIGAGTDNKTIIAEGTYNRTIIATGDSVYATNKENGHIYKYDGKPNNWKDIGSPGDTTAPGRSFAASNSTLYAVKSDGTDIFEWKGVPFEWTRIGVGVVGGADKIVFVGNTLFATNTDTGDIYKYNGKPDDWTDIG